MLFDHLSIKDMILASLFAALTSIGAFLVLPFYPVPLTFQSLFIYLVAMLLGRKIALLSQIIYISLGFIGLPVFAAGKSGPGVLFGPTGGYLWGFAISAYVIGNIVERNNIKEVKNFVIAGIMGILIINFFGALQLYLVTRLNVKTILLSSILPFLPGDFIKVLIASFIAHKLKLTFTRSRMI